MIEQTFYGPRRVLEREGMLDPLAQDRRSSSRRDRESQDARDGSVFHAHLPPLGRRQDRTRGPRALSHQRARSCYTTVRKNDGNRKDPWLAHATAAPSGSLSRSRAVGLIGR